MNYPKDLFTPQYTLTSYTLRMTSHKHTLVAVILLLNESIINSHSLSSKFCYDNRTTSLLRICSKPSHRASRLLGRSSAEAVKLITAPRWLIKSKSVIISKLCPVQFFTRCHTQIWLWWNCLFHGFHSEMWGFLHVIVLHCFWASKCRYIFKNILKISTYLAINPRVSNLPSANTQPFTPRIALAFIQTLIQLYFFMKLLMPERNVVARAKQEQITKFFKRLPKPDNNNIY